MNELEQRLVSLDLTIARSKPMRDQQEKDLKRVKSYKADGVAAKELLDRTKKTLKSAKAERKAIIAKLLKAADAAAKKPERRTIHAS
jgi:multidrug resistance efflux pump